MPNPKKRATFHKRLIFHVRRALRHINRVIVLSESPLARTEIVKDAVVLGPGAALADYGRTLRSVLQWAVASLAASPPVMIRGQRPIASDPIWTDAALQPFLILYYQFFEPIPVTERIEQGTLIETLLQRMEIRDRNTFVRLRDRAIHDVARLIATELKERTHRAEIQERVCEDWLLPLRTRPSLLCILEFAAVFRHPVPRAALVAMASAEFNERVDTHIDFLILHRYLQVFTGRSDVDLAVPERLCAHMDARITARKAKQWRERAISYYRDTDDKLELIWQLQRAGRHVEAVKLYIDHVSDFALKWPISDVLRVAQQFPPTSLTAGQLFEIQLAISHLEYAVERREPALNAARLALRTALSDEQKGRAYLSMGIICSRSDYQLAEMYFTRAEELLPDTHPELSVTWLRRAGMLVSQKRYEQAEVYLQRIISRPETADAQALPGAELQLARIMIARGNTGDAKTKLLRLMMDWEEKGNTFFLGHVCIAVGLAAERERDVEQMLYWADKAANFYETCQFAQGIHNSLGMKSKAWAMAKRFDLAVPIIEEMITTSRKRGDVMSEMYGYLNCVRFYAELANWRRAVWNFFSASYLAKRLKAEPMLDTLTDLSHRHAPLQALIPTALSLEEDAAIYLAFRDGWVAWRTLSDETGIARSSAGRLLTRLVGYNLLVRHGSSRATHYRLSTEVAAQPTADFPGGQAEGTAGAEAALHDLFRRFGKIDLKIVLKETALSRSTAQRVLRRMVESGKVLPVGKGRTTQYLPIKQPAAS